VATVFSERKLLHIHTHIYVFESAPKTSFASDPSLVQFSLSTGCKQRVRSTRPRTLIEKVEEKTKTC